MTVVGGVRQAGSEPPPTLPPLAAPSALPAGRWVAAGALAATEYAVLGVAVDTTALAQRFPWLLHARDVAALALAGAAAVAMLGWERQREWLDPLRTAERPPHPWLPAVAHAASYAAFAWLTLRLLGSPAALPEPLGAWLALWVALAVSSLASLALLLLAPGALLRLAWASRGLLAGAAGVAALAMLLAPLSNLLWRPLSSFTLLGAAILLTLAGGAPQVDLPSWELGLGSFRVAVAEPCSGVEGLGLVTAFVAGWLTWNRGRLRWPHALLLFPLGAVAALAANVVRIASLVWLGEHLSPAVALGGFHSRSGWILFCGVALGLTLASRRLPAFAAHPEEEAEATWNPVAAWAGPFVAALAVALCTEALSPGFDALYGLRLVAALWVLHAHRAVLPAPRLSLHPLALAVGAAVAGLWLWLEPSHGTADGAGLRAGLADLPGWARAAWLAVRVAGTIAVIPLIEELAFRGWLLRRLQGAEFTEVSYRQAGLGALLVSSLAFGAVHQRWVAGTLAGLAFALLARWRGRLSDAVTAHATANALLAAAALAGGHLRLWR